VIRLGSCNPISLTHGRNEIPRNYDEDIHDDEIGDAKARGGIKDESNAFREGYAAHENELSADDNPYEVGSINWSEWLRGFEWSEMTG
jgi:hypothetical protein